MIIIYNGSVKFTIIFIPKLLINLVNIFDMHPVQLSELQIIS